jgi:hypothetical protein
MMFAAAVSRFAAAATRYCEIHDELRWLRNAPPVKGRIKARQTRISDLETACDVWATAMRHAAAEATALAGDDARTAARKALRTWRRGKRILEAA